MSVTKELIFWENYTTNSHYNSARENLIFWPQLFIYLSQVALLLKYAKLKQNLNMIGCVCTGRESTSIDNN